jgi:hypothetical protein
MLWREAEDTGCYNFRTYQRGCSVGMVANFYQVTPEQLAEFLRRPAVAYDYTLTPFFENPTSVEWAENVLAELRNKTEGFPAGVRVQVERLAEQLKSKSQVSKGPQLMKSRSKPQPARRVFSLEKDWHVLHCATRWRDWPACRCNTWRPRDSRRGRRDQLRKPAVPIRCVIWIPQR